MGTVLIAQGRKYGRRDFTVSYGSEAYKFQKITIGGAYGLSRTADEAVPRSTLVISNLIPYSRVKIYKASDSSFIQQASVGAGTSITLLVPFSGSVYVEARNASSSPAYMPWVTTATISPTTTTQVGALQQVD
jgi:hypothetical protein